MIEVENYDKLIKEFGTKPISSVKNLPRYYTFDKEIVFSHRDFDKFMNAVKNKKKVSILTGFNASGSIHLGHKRTFDTVIFLQKKYKIPVYIPISDDESYVFRKIKDQKEGLKNAKLIAKQMIALGFDKKLTKIFIHQDYTKIYNLAIKLSRPTLSELKAIYGFNDSTNAGTMFYPVIQAADILFPQELIGNHMTVVPIGIDQDPHMRLSRDLASRLGYMKPAAIHLKYLPGLRGSKMSTTKPETGIFLDDKPDKTVKKVMNALTGGRETIAEQKKLGGEPDKCVVFDYHDMFLNEKELTKIKKNCLAGRLMCGDCKKILAKNVKNYLKDFQAKVKKVKVEKYLM
jgi:tryptophanyl-tRNA synthetase